MAYTVTIEGHQIVVSDWKLYIDGDFRDRYDGDLYSANWRTVLRGSIVRKDGHKAIIEVQLKAIGLFSRGMRFLCDGKEITMFKY